MEGIKFPEFPRLRGEKAIKALYDFITELEEQKGEELTEKQIRGLTKFAQGLISSIQAEIRIAEEIKEMRLERRLRKAIANYVPQPFNRLLGR